MKISKIFLLPLCLFITLCSEDNFIVKQDVTAKNKNASKNELKEDIGSTMKATVDECAFISATIGEILEKIGSDVEKNVNDKNLNLIEAKKLLTQMAQINKTVGQPLKEIGILQQKYSDKIEKLIDNKKPFKSAGHGTLKSALNDSSNLLSNLKIKSKNLNKLKLNLFAEKVDCGKKILQLTEEVSINFRTQLQDIETLRLQFCKNDCLK
ncbi:TPA: hypothetical protein DEO28_03990 [Candidatus Dependentiae bacterium]|nr:MAG: hypothetical protein UR14_C0006G0035 [candidate division TM6 bacterium GW2011_GWE2_31_21]KKP53542.1 MAG: hypothetical protein UR43_C0004G0083 [candidate division TM6 bacterium GW2011_GWF2_33_332]HBS48217.1 hypothetical protein [Candidatus Dependentiae bacterium]HBZ73643.1 hypothetical protein [Candidatus Dependentiae bacterium]